MGRIGLNHPLNRSQGEPVLFPGNEKARLDTITPPVERILAGQKDDPRQENSGGDCIHGATALLGEVNTSSPDERPLYLLPFELTSEDRHLIGKKFPLVEGARHRYLVRKNAWSMHDVTYQMIPGEVQPPAVPERNSCMAVTMSIFLSRLIVHRGTPCFGSD